VEDAELPPHVALLWGRRPAPRRGRAPGLTLDGITRAAVTVADAEGLGAVSMARVAAELGSAPMSLYRYVASKDELLLLMADAALEEPPVVLPGETWRERLTAWAHGVLAMFRAHPWYREIPITGPPSGPRNLAWFDRALGALRDVALPEEEKVLVVMGLMPVVHGQARLSIDLAAGYAEDPQAFGAAYGAALAAMVDPVRFPALSRTVSAGVFGPGGPGGGEELPPEGYDDFGPEFAFALTCYLDGVAGFIAARSGG
jgi:AcrR family transcriptional regulator